MRLKQASKSGWGSADDETRESLYWDWVFGWIQVVHCGLRSLRQVIGFSRGILQSDEEACDELGPSLVMSLGQHWKHT